ncbi:MAG TPA: exosome complex protein Rrp42 [Candidatus Paceibacterota bacterium]|nr:exosome complex protein Rrp42 [Candidatus Paceibacterota bacterium]
MIETSNLTKDRILTYLSEGRRFDNRKLDEYRELTIELGISKKAEGSAKVKLGKTEVWVGVKMEIGEPYPDSPDKGNLTVTAELIPLSHGKYEYGPPRFEAIEVGRLVDRGIRESKYINFEKLCIQEGEKVWTICIDIYSINDDGNLIDAAFIGALAALRDAKIPNYDEKEDKIDYEKEAKQKVPLFEENMPINFTIFQAGNVIFLDPTLEEENSSHGKLTLAFIPTNPIRICSMQKGDTLQVSPEKFAEMLEFAEKKHKTFFPEINKTIEEAIKAKEKKKDK